MHSICLYVIIFLVGIDVGSNKKIIKDIKAIGVIKVLIIPIAVILGSLVGGLISGVIFKMPYNESLAVASGFGWYSLSGIMLTELANAQLGAMAFLSNVFREVIAVVSYLYLAKN